MGEVRVGIVVINPRTGAHSEEISALADTGATLSVVPTELLERLGIEKLRTVPLVLADRPRAERGVGCGPLAPKGRLGRPPAENIPYRRMPILVAMSV